MSIREIQPQGYKIIHKLSIFIALVLSIYIAACSNISEKELSELQSSNHIIKQAAILEISKERGFPRSLISYFLSNDLEKKAVAILVDMLCREKESEEIQVCILKSLGDLNKRVEVPIAPLINKLKDENPRILFQTVESLGKIKNKKAVPALLQLLERVPDKYPIVWALGEIRDQRAIPALNALLISKDSYLQYNARKALNKIQ